MKFLKKKDGQVEIGKWYVGWKSWDFEITYRTRGYNYDNAELHISLFGWHSMIRLPWKHKRKDWYREEKKYGVAVFHNTIYRYWGWKLKGWDLPFVSYPPAIRWERYKGNPDSFLLSSLEKENWEAHPSRTKYEGGCQEPTTWSYNYTDPYDGTVVPCKYWVEEMEWRPKWLTWTNKFSKIRRYIEVEFSQEMGSMKGSWKGGTIGCSYNILPYEHPNETIQRMEKEYKFR